MATLIQEMSKFEEKDAELISSINRFGNPTSLLLLNSACRTFHLSEINGMIGYQLIGNCAVVIGDPLCSAQDIPKLTQAFDADCRKEGRSVVYLLASESFAHSEIHHTCHTLLQVGDKLILDPTKFKMKQKLRWKMHQSIEHGVTIKEYDQYNPKIENHLKETMQKWQSEKHGPQIYLGTLDLFEDYGNKRIFFAEHEGEIVGILMVLYLAATDGWVLTSLLALKGSPIGVTEHLMSHVLSALTEENCHYLCLGFVSAANVGEMEGISSFSQSLIQWTYGLSRWLFHLDAKRIYFNKYHPTYYPAYILCSDKLGLKELLAIKTTLNVKL